jgi:putative inorganic carbon (hco3(-)) transporter
LTQSKLFSLGEGEAHAPSRAGLRDRGARRLAVSGRSRNGRRPWDLLMLAAAGLLLVGQARIQVLLPFSIPRPAVLLGIVAFGIWIFQRERIRSLTALKSDGVAKATLVFLLVTLIGVPFSLSIGGSARFLLDSLSRTFLVFLILAVAVRNLHDVRRLVATYAVGAAIFGVMAPVERAMGRSVGGYDPNDAAMFLTSGIPPLVFFVIHGRRPWVRISAALAILPVLGGIAATQSRGGFIAVAAVIAFMIFALSGVRPAVRVGIVILIVLAGIPLSSSDYWERMRTITELDDGYGGDGRVGGRRNIWGRAVEHALANPLTGVGVNQFTRAEGQHPDIRARIEAGIGTKYTTAHSMWFQVLAELGFPGLLAFLALFALAFRNLRRLQKVRGPPLRPPEARELRTMAGVLMASLVAVMVAGSFLTHAYSTMIWAVLAIVVGFGKVMPRQATRAIGRSHTGGLRRSMAGPLRSGRRHSHERLSEGGM